MSPSSRDSYMCEGGGTRVRGRFPHVRSPLTTITTSRAKLPEHGEIPYLQYADRNKKPFFPSQA